MTITTIFRDYLIAHKLKQRYERNFRNNVIYGCPIDIDWKCDILEQIRVRKSKTKGDPPSVTAEMLMGRHCMNSIFSWAETPEGLAFWNHEDEKWEKYFRELFIKIINRNSL